MGYDGAMSKKCYTHLNAEEQSPIDVSETHRTNPDVPCLHRDTLETSSGPYMTQSSRAGSCRVTVIRLA